MERSGFRTRSSNLLEMSLFGITIDNDRADQVFHQNGRMLESQIRWLLAVDGISLSARYHP